MLYTAEARWFIPEILPDAVLDWFGATQAIESEGVQVHEYLLFPDCDSVGVKLRDGRLEIKAMRGASQPLIQGLGIHGRTEQWVKWSFASEGLQALDQALHQSGPWLKVRKERFLRRFSAERDRLMEVTARGTSGVFSLAANWNRKGLLEAGVNPSWTNSLFPPNASPISEVYLLNSENRGLVSERSSRFRKEVRGESIGALG